MQNFKPKESNAREGLHTEPRKLNSDGEGLASFVLQFKLRQTGNSQNSRDEDIDDEENTTCCRELQYLRGTI